MPIRLIAKEDECRNGETIRSMASRGVLGVRHLVCACRSQDRQMGRCTGIFGNQTDRQELIYGMPTDDKGLPTAQANFIAKEQKLLLLFAHNNEEKKEFASKFEKLRSVAEAKT